MALVNASTLIALQKGFRGIIQVAIDSADPMWKKVAMEVPSEVLTEEYHWLGSVPKMKEWLGNKQIDQLRGASYLLTNKEWESTFGIKRVHIETDSLGMYRPKIMSLGDEAMRHPDELLSTIRLAGNTSTGLCFDGQQFYDTDHVWGDSGTLSNKVTGTGVTAAAVRADYYTAKARMRSFRDDKNRPLITKAGTMDLVATIPPALEGVFEELANPGPGSTTPKTVIPYMVDPYLSDANDWYLDYVGSPMRPFVVQMRKRPMAVALEDPNASDTVFMRQEFLYSVEASYNAGYALWWLSILITNT